MGEARGKKVPGSSRASVQPATITEVSVCVVKAKSTRSQKDVGVWCLETWVDILTHSFFIVNDDDSYITESPSNQQMATGII